MVERALEAKALAPKAEKDVYKGSQVDVDHQPAPYWLLAKYGTQRDDCYKHIANGLINHVVRVLEAHLGALALLCSRVPVIWIMEPTRLMSGVHLIGLLSITSF